MTTRIFSIYVLAVLMIIIVSIMIGVFAVVPTVHAAEDGAFTNPLNTPNPLTSKNTSEALAAVVQPWARIVRSIVAMLGTLMFLMLLWGGFQYMTAAGDPEKAGAGLKTVLWAALGGGVILASYVLAAWLIWPLGNIFGLHTGGLSDDNGSTNNKDGATFACCQFDVGGQTKCKEIQYKTIASCQSTSPFWTPNYPMVLVPGTVTTPRADQQYTLVAERSGVHCGDIPACSGGAVAEPEGCCVANAAVAAWKGLRCSYGPQSACDGGKTFHRDTPCDQVSKGACRQWTDCCRYKNGTNVVKCVSMQNDGTTDGRRLACLSEQPSGTIMDVLSGDCTQHTSECAGAIVQPRPPTDGNTPPSANQKCCIPDPQGWTYSTNRGVCFPPTLDANQNPVCTSGWTLASQACSSFTTTCTKLQPNPPLEKSGCCYWRATPGVTPTCEQRISESLCNQDHRDLPKEDVWFIERGAILELCTPKPGGVQCVSGTGSTL